MIEEQLVIGSWFSYYNQATNLLKKKDYKKAYHCTMKCFDFVKYDLESDQEKKQAVLIEQYFKTILLIKDCYKKKGCLNCAEKQLRTGLCCFNKMKGHYACTKFVKLVIDKAIDDIKIEIRKFYLEHHMVFRDSLFSNYENKKWSTTDK